VLVVTLLGMQLVSGEKQQRMIGILRIMGMNESNYWSSWLLFFALLAFVASMLATGMGKISGLMVWAHCDFSIHFLALLLFITSMSSLGLVFNSVINRSGILSLVSFLLFFAATVTDVFFGNANGNFIFASFMPGYVQVLVFIFPWFHYSKIWADILLHTADKQQIVHQFEYKWSQFTDTQRIYDECCMATKHAVDQRRAAHATMRRRPPPHSGVWCSSRCCTSSSRGTSLRYLVRHSA
jgi:hypothetical protein